MKYFHPVLAAAAALCALTVNNAYAGSAGAATNVTANVTGSTGSSGNSSAFVVATSMGSASATAVTSPAGQSVKTTAVDSNNVHAQVHVGAWGTASATGKVEGNASASAWASP
jgi:hypothetical protein